MEKAGHVLFYDGVCGLCDRLVQFVLQRDRAGKFRFATLQSPLASDTLVPRGHDPTDLNTAYVLTADGSLLRKSRAILFVFAQLGGGWRLLSWLRVVPVFLTDGGYDVVAALRYRLFGKRDSCRIPDARSRDRFLDGAT